MSTLDDARASCVSLAQSCNAVLAVLESTIASMRTAAETTTQQLGSVRGVVLASVANYQRKLHSRQLRLSLTRREVELVVPLANQSLFGKAISDLGIPGVDVQTRVAMWTGKVEAWSETAELVVSVAGGELTIPLAVSVSSTSGKPVLTLRVAAAPIFSGPPIVRTFFSNGIPVSQLFARVVSFDLPTISLATAPSPLSRAHLLDEAVRLFDASSNSGSPEIGAVPTARDDLTLYLQRAFLARLVTSVSGFPANTIDIIPQEKSLRFYYSRSKDQGLDGVCTLEVTVRAEIRVWLNITLNSIRARGKAVSAKASAELDGLVCDIAEAVIRGTANALGQKIYTEMSLPTDANPVTKDIQCQGIRLMRLLWSQTSVGIEFRRPNSLDSTISCS